MHGWNLRIVIGAPANRSPSGMYEFVKKGDAPVVGITKLDGITMEDLKRPRRAVPLPMPGAVAAAAASAASSAPATAPAL